jgi:drug/metabolite transporter (DMT)-like permease
MDNNIKYYLLMVLATIMWAGAFIAGKLGINEFTPVILTYLRILIAFLILFPIMKKRNPKTWKLEKESYILVLSLGLIGMTGYHLLFFNALRFTTASNASVINAFNPLITAVFAAMILKDKLSIRKIALIISAFLGVTLTITQWDLSIIISGGFNIGDLLMLSGATSWAIYSILVKKGMKKMSPMKLTTYSFLACVIILTPFALKEIIFDQALKVQPTAYLAIFYMAIFPTVGGYTIQQYSIKALGPSTTALFINLVPVFSIIMAVIFLKEDFYYLNALSILMIIFSVYTFIRLKEKPSLK